MRVAICKEKLTGFTVGNEYQEQDGVWLIDDDGEKRFLRHVQAWMSIIDLDAAECRAQEIFPYPPMSESIDEQDYGLKCQIRDACRQAYILGRKEAML